MIWTTVMKLKFLCSALATIACCLPIQAEESATSDKEIIRISVADGKIQGQVFAMFDDEKAPLIGKVSLTDTEGNTISTLKTDDQGNFAFTDVEPGKYKAIGIAGDYVGDAEIEVTLAKDNEESKEYYTAIPLAVAPAGSAALFDTYASLPASSFSASTFGGSTGGCSSCGGGYSVQTFSGSGCGGACGGGGLNFRRLALIGAAVAIPIALSGGNDDNGTPAED